MELVPFSPEEKEQLEEEEEQIDSEFEMVVQDDSLGSDGFVFGSASNEKPSVEREESNCVSKPKRVIGDGKSLNDYK